MVSDKSIWEFLYYQIVCCLCEKKIIGRNPNKIIIVFVRQSGCVTVAYWTLGGLCEAKMQSVDTKQLHYKITPHLCVLFSIFSVGHTTTPHTTEFGRYVVVTFVMMFCYFFNTVTGIIERSCVETTGCGKKESQMFSQISACGWQNLDGTKFCCRIGYNDQLLVCKVP